MPSYANQLQEYQNKLQNQILSGETSTTELATQTNNSLQLAEEFQSTLSAFNTALADFELSLSNYINLFEGGYLDENVDAEVLKSRMKDKIEKGYRSL